MTMKIDDSAAIGAPSLILQALLAQLTAQLGLVATVYDPDLSYEKVAGGLRAVRRSKELPKLPDGIARPFPFLGFNRGPVTLQPQLGLRATNRAVLLATDPALQTDVHVAWGEMLVTFSLFESDPLRLERLETGYLTRSFISNLKDVTVSLPIIGDFQYHIQWGTDLDGLTSSKDNVEYHSVNGMARIEGPFFLMKAGPNRSIQRIVLDVRDWANKVLYTRFDHSVGPPAATTITDGPEFLPTP